MDCKKTESMLSEYSLGFLSLVESSELKAHLDACGGCKERLIRIEATAALVSQVPAVAPPADLWPGIERRIVQQAARDTARPRSIWRRSLLVPRRALALAGSLVVAAVMFSVFFPFWPTTSTVIPISDTGAVTYVHGHASLAIGNPLADPSGLILVAGMASREDAALCVGRTPKTSQW